MCGEQEVQAERVEFLEGSPPRVRGTEQDFEVYKADVRITPACAGNSIRRYGNAIVGQDHPRVCGEQI